MKSRLWYVYETWLFILIVVWLACKAGTLLGAPPKQAGPKPLQYALAAVDDRGGKVPPAKPEKSRTTRYYNVKQAENGRWFAVVSDGGLYSEDTVWGVLDALNAQKSRGAGCACSSSCTCGCQDGLPCDCGTKRPARSGEALLAEMRAEAARMQAQVGRMLYDQVRAVTLAPSPAPPTFAYQPARTWAYAAPAYPYGGGRRGGSC